MHGRIRLNLILIHILIPSLFADTVPGEWIAIRAPDSHESWRGYDTFGPGNRFALVRKPEETPPGAYYLQPNFLYHGLGADPDLAQSWGLPAIAAPAAWNVFPGSSGTIVAVIDTGIDAAHEELRDTLWTDAQGAHGWNVLAKNDQTADDNGHGTFCAGIIGAQADNGHGSRGVTRARLMAVKSFDAHFYGTTADQITAIEWAVNHGARILNASWGGTGYDQALYETIRWAGNQGALMVAAAGNDSVDNDGKDGPTYPAAFRLPNVISVAAIDSTGKLAAFSNYGRETVHLAAPGVAIYGPTRNNGYRFDEGTSFAAAHVTGVAALLADYLPSLGAAGWRDRLLATSRVISYYEKERLVTAGLVNAYNALTDVRPPRPRAPESWRRTPRVIASEHPYANGTDQTYEIWHPGAKNIRVHFTRFRTEGCCDKLTLSDAAGRTVFVYGGDRGAFTSADALGEKLVLHFTSDGVGTDWGFETDYDEASY